MIFQVKYLWYFSETRVFVYSTVYRNNNLKPKNQNSLKSIFWLPDPTESKHVFMLTIEFETGTLLKEDCKHMETFSHWKCCPLNSTNIFAARTATNRVWAPLTYHFANSNSHAGALCRQATEPTASSDCWETKRFYGELFKHCFLFTTRHKVPYDTARPEAFERCFSRDTDAYYHYHNINSFRASFTYGFFDITSSSRNDQIGAGGKNRFTNFWNPFTTAEWNHTLFTLARGLAGVFVCRRSFAAWSSVKARWREVDVWRKKLCSSVKALNINAPAYEIFSAIQKLFLWLSIST